MVTSMAAVKGGCTAAVTVRDVAEGVATAVKSAGREKHAATAEWNAAYKKKKLHHSDVELVSYVDKMVEVGKIWNETPAATLSQHLTIMRNEDKI